MVGQNGTFVNPEPTFREIRPHEGRPDDGCDLPDRLAAAEWRVAFLEGYIHGFVSSLCPGTKEWMNP